MVKLVHASILAITTLSVCMAAAQEKTVPPAQTNAVTAPAQQQPVTQPVTAPVQQQSVNQNVAPSSPSAPQATQQTALPEPTISDASVAKPTPPSENVHIMTAAVDDTPMPIDVDPEADVELESSQEEPIGIDTIHLQEPQGNWLFKRIWWERAQERYEKIRLLVDQVWEMRVGFFLNRSEIDRTKLDPFYLFIGFEQGAVQEELNSLIEKLTQEEQAAGSLDTEEKTLLLDIQEQKKVLEGLRSDIDLITQLDHSIDDSLERLMEQINRVRVYERESWNYFKEIAQVLSDTKARELYYKMDTSWRNIKDIYKYLQNDFLAHFQDVAVKLSNELARIRGFIEGLKEKGFDLKKQSELLKEAANQPAQPTVSDEDDEDDEAPKKGFFASMGSTIVEGFSLFWSVVTSPFTYLYHKIAG